MTSFITSDLGGGQSQDERQLERLVEQSLFTLVSAEKRRFAPASSSDQPFGSFGTLGGESVGLGQKKSSSLMMELQAHICAVPTLAVAEEILPILK